MASALRSELRRPSAATVITLVALFVALDGPNAVASGVRTSARLVTGAQIKDGSLTTRDLSRRARAALAGRRGPAGPRGATGRPGVDGLAFRWQGVWRADAAYAAGDVVSSDGGSYISTASSTGAPPARSPAWDVVAERGARGPAGRSRPGGTFTSPNGLFRLKVLDDRIALEGPTGKVVISGAGVDAGAGALQTRVVAPVVALNGTCAPVARADDRTDSALGWQAQPLPGGGTMIVPIPHQHPLAGGSLNVFAC